MNRNKKTIRFNFILQIYEILRLCHASILFICYFPQPPPFSMVGVTDSFLAKKSSYPVREGRG